MTASSIFISYRRSDSALYARNLYTDLKGRFGDHEIFMDLGVGLGEDFVTRIEQQIESCAVLLVLIGPDWDSAVDEDGRRRIDDPEDLVRLEIETALARSVRVIPLFVRGANMPKADELPGSLAGLARRNGLALRDDGWEADVAR